MLGLTCDRADSWEQDETDPLLADRRGQVIHGIDHPLRVNGDKLGICASDSHSNHATQEKRRALTTVTDDSNSNVNVQLISG